ncbi:hypothetical protein Agub_g5151, partial [Astrephomene gubernaculifera]
LDVYCGATGAVGAGALEVRRACAESFTAVAEQAGHEHWPQLQPVWVRLLASNDGPSLSSLVATAEKLIRLRAAAAPDNTSGSSLPELHRAAEQVVSGPFLDQVLRNRLHMVASAAAAALPGLLAVCPPAIQRELLQLLPQLCAAPDGPTGRCGEWRTRLSLASQLHAALRAVMAAETGPDAAAAVARCAVTLCGDPVWAVRQAAAAQVGVILAEAVSAAPTASSAASEEASPVADAGKAATAAEADTASSGLPAAGTNAGRQDEGAPGASPSGRGSGDAGFGTPGAVATTCAPPPSVADAADSEASTSVPAAPAQEAAAEAADAGGLTEAHRAWLARVAEAAAARESGEAGAEALGVLAAWLAEAAQSGGKAGLAIASCCCVAALGR